MTKKVPTNKEVIAQLVAWAENTQSQIEKLTTSVSELSKTVETLIFVNQTKASIASGSIGPIGRNVRIPKVKPMPSELEEKLACWLSEAQKGNILLVYTDGSVACMGLPEQASGSAAVMYHEDLMTVSSMRTKGGTNNVGELVGIFTAFVSATAYLKSLSVEDRSQLKEIVIVSDSQYAINSTLGTFNGTLNKELITTNRAFLKTFNQDTSLQVTISWVRGHAGNPLNTIADFYAGRASLGEVTLVHGISRSLHEQPMDFLNRIASDIDVIDNGLVKINSEVNNVTTK